MRREDACSDVWLFTLFLSITHFLPVTLKPNCGEREFIFPHRVDSKGFFLTYNIPHFFKQTPHRNFTIKNDIVHYNVKINNEDLHIELEPNRGVLSRGSEQDNDFNGHNHQREYLNQVKVKRFSDNHCQYYGHVRNKTNSKVALSNCDGLMGYIKVNNEFFMIEPIKKISNITPGRPHCVYRHHFSPQPSQRKSSQKARLHRRKVDRRGADKYHWVWRAEPGSIRQMYLETLVVLDKTLLEYHTSMDLDNYILTVFNMAHTLFRDSSFGAPLELVIVRLISLEREDDEMNLGITKDAPKVLEVFKAWANRINPPDDYHPSHHDIAILITRVDICMKDDTDSCGLLGLASLASVCDPEEQALLVEDNGLVLGFTIAHEIGHAMGLWHDGLSESGCEAAPYGDGYGVVMSTHLSAKIRGWSSCSREYLWAFIDAGMAECLLDEPATPQLSIAEVLPGAVYGESFQCRSLVDNSVDKCPDVGVECNNMKCWMPEYGCVETRRPLAEGTACGEQAWCYGGRCLNEGQRPAAIDGGWGEWGEWSQCSRTCGSGVRKSTRSCDKPRPEHGGFYCKGQRVQFEVCNDQACAFEAPPYRDVQCAEFDTWLYPEDNQTHTWKSYISSSERQCALVCANELHQLALLKAVAADGTPCHSGRGHLCVAGQCKVVGCDGVLDSEAVEDACGVCRGGGDTCTVRRGQTTLKRSTKAQLVLAVPVNTQFAVFEETSPTKAKFLVRSGKSTVVSNNKFGSSVVKNMKFWMGYVRHEQELLKIVGPVTEVLQVYIQTNEEVTIKYSIGNVLSNRIGEYSWQGVGWSECSVPCGVGTHYTIHQCLESVNGIVDNKYCLKLEKPKTETRICELRKCEPRWQVGEWSGCDCACPDDTVDERSVACVRGGGAEGTDHFVEDSLCPAPKPVSERNCNCPPPTIHRHTANSKIVTRKFRNTLSIVQGKLKNITRTASSKNLYKNKKPHGSMTNIIHRDHSKNVQSMKESKGNLIQDYENLKDFQLALEIDEQNANKQIKDFPKQFHGENKAIIQGVAAVKIIQKIQESHHSSNNKLK